MHQGFIRILERIRDLQNDITFELNTGYDLSSFEDRKAKLYLNKLIEDLDYADHILTLMSKPAVQGKLAFDSNTEKFRLIRDDNGNPLSYLFNCGSYLEMLNPEDRKWYSGLVEHAFRHPENRKSGYYFNNVEMGNPYLHEGMIARVRL